jgi:hypothetical protein
MVAATGTRPTDRSAPPWPETTPRSLRSDLAWLHARVAAAVEARPFAAVAIAAGAGFLLGGGISRPTLGVLIQTGSRVAANWLGEALRTRGLHEDGVAPEEPPE